MCGRKFTNVRKDFSVKNSDDLCWKEITRFTKKISQRVGKVD